MSGPRRAASSSAESCRLCASPAASLPRQTLRTVAVPVNELVRVSSYLAGEPHFGRGAKNLFDDPQKSPRSGYGTCYLATDLTVAMAETLLHDEAPVRNGFHIAETEVLKRHVIRFTGAASLVVADHRPRAEGARREFRALHRRALRHPAGLGLGPASASTEVDGLLYMSRHVNDRKGIVVFDRAAAKFAGATSRPLIDDPGALRALMDLHIRIQYA